MPFPRVKGQIYDDGFHVPFAVRWGEKINPGREVTDFITFPDLAPTLMEIAGLEAPDTMTGRSFAPQLFAEGSGRIEADRDYTLLGKERHDIRRTDGELLSVAFTEQARFRNWRFIEPAWNSLEPLQPRADGEAGPAGRKRTLLSVVSRISANS